MTAIVIAVATLMLLGALVILLERRRGLSPTTALLTLTVAIGAIAAAVGWTGAAPGGEQPPAHIADIQLPTI